MFPAITHILHSTYGEINHLQLPSKIKFQAILFNIYQKLLTEQNQSLKISVFGKDLNSKELPLPTPNPTGPPKKKTLCSLHPSYVLCTMSLLTAQIVLEQYFPPLTFN